jgi:hypothetical protein
VIGLLTPPVGVVLSVGCGIARIPVGGLARHVRPFVAVMYALAAGVHAGAGDRAVPSTRGGILMADALGFAHAIGVITPSGNLVVERIATRLLQVFPAVPAHYARIGMVGQRDPLPDSYDLDGMLPAARPLSHAKPSVGTAFPCSTRRSCRCGVRSG